MHIYKHKYVLYLYIYEYVWIGEWLDVSGLMGVGRGSWERELGKEVGRGGSAAINVLPFYPL